MSRTQFKLNCQITNQQDNQILHLEIRNKLDTEECYFKHFSFDELSLDLQSLFNNLSHLYVYVNKPGCVYFDEEESTLKVCILIADNVVEFPIPLETKNREQILPRKIFFLQQQKARLEDEFSQLLEQKTKILGETKSKIQKQREELNVLKKQEMELSRLLQDLEQQISNFQEECDLKMSIVRKYKQENHQTNKIQSESVGQNKLQEHCQKSEIDIEVMESQPITSDKASVQKSEDITSIKREKNGEKSKNWAVNFTLKEANQLENRKQFWIKEVEGLRKPNTLILKELINSEKRFEEEKVITIHGIQLKKMLFVEIFINLEILDLSVNNIKNMEGLGNLKKLRKMDLSQNMIEEIRGLGSNLKLEELNLSNNKIKAIEGVFHLINLVIFNLCKNQIKEIPKKIYKLANLQKLHMDHNSLLRVSDNIDLLKKLKEFTLVGNKCYSDNNKSKEVIDKLINKGVITVNNQFRQFTKK